MQEGNSGSKKGGPLHLLVRKRDTDHFARARFGQNAGALGNGRTGCDNIVDQHDFASRGSASESERISAAYIFTALFMRRSRLLAGMAVLVKQGPYGNVQRMPCGFGKQPGSGRNHAWKDAAR